MATFFHTARDYVLSSLRAEILKGLHPDGARLRQEEVAKRLKVSTTPVREAFRDLLAEGLVSIDPHKGVVTRGLTSRGVKEIYELRLLLEPMLAQRSCSHTTAAQLSAARACQDIMSKTDDPEQWSILNEEFHRYFVETQSHTRLFDITLSLAAAARPYVVLSMHVKPEIIAANNHDHEEIWRAYQSGDETAVFIHTRAHLANTRDAILACVELSPQTLPMTF